MAIISNKRIFPQIDYGQGNEAWNPSSRAAVYQQINLARHEPEGAFAQAFMADVMFGKEETGRYYYQYETHTVYDENGNAVGTTTVLSRISTGYSSYLYNDNTLNAAASWVPQAFLPPVVLDSGVWRNAHVLTRYEFMFPGMRITWGFVGIDATTDAFVLRMMDGGHYAFSALGDNNVTAYLPWARGYEPRKRGRGMHEAGNAKELYG